MGYRHMADHAKDRMHRDTASQAGRVGLWQWAVFIFQHIDDVGRRREAVEAVLDRNIAECDEKEKFLVDDLGIPMLWATQGWVYHRFISVEQAMSTLLQARDEATIHYELEKLKPMASSEHSEGVVKWTLVTLDCCGDVEENPGPGSERLV